MNPMRMFHPSSWMKCQLTMLPGCTGIRWLWQIWIQVIHTMDVIIISQRLENSEFLL